MKTLEDYFRIEESKQSIDQMVRIQMRGPFVTFYIHAHGRNSDTLDFLVVGNELRELPSVATCNHPLEYAYSFPITSATTGNSVNGRYCLCGKNLLPEMKPDSKEESD